MKKIMMPLVAGAFLGLAACGNDRDAGMDRTTPAAETTPGTTAPGTMTPGTTGPGMAPAPGAPGTMHGDTMMMHGDTLHGAGHQGTTGTMPPATGTTRP
jgi:hypothetical protein